jgi:spore coat polysaccharide biosynthesis protein SpsF
MGSTRLPGKILKDIQEKTVLAHVIDRVKRAKQVDEIVIATTDLTRDITVAEEAIRCGVKYYIGSEDDVLSRYYYAAKENRADIVVRITSDCPLIDPGVIDSIVQLYKENNYVLVTNASSNLSQRTFPRGLDTEVFCLEALEEAFHKAIQTYQREHVTPYIYENYDNLFYYKNKIDYSKYRWTLDTEEDFQLICEVYRHLYKKNRKFHFADIIDLMERYPEIARINEHVEQKKVK